MGESNHDGDYSLTYPSKINDSNLYLDAHYFGNCLRYVNDLEEHNLKKFYIQKDDNTWGIYFVAIMDIEKGD